MTTQEYEKKLITENEELKEFKRKIIAFYKYNMFRAFGNPMVYPSGQNGKKRVPAVGGMELKILDNIISGKKPYQGTNIEKQKRKALSEVIKNIERYKKEQSHHLPGAIEYKQKLEKELAALDFDTLHASRWTNKTNDHEPQVSALRQTNQHRPATWQRHQRGQDSGRQGQREQTAEAWQPATR